jgi:hypothetical protein
MGAGVTCGGAGIILPRPLVDKEPWLEACGSNELPVPRVDSLAFETPRWLDPDSGGLCPKFVLLFAALVDELLRTCCLGASANF